MVRNKKKDLISLIVPVYRQEKTIEKELQTLHNTLKTINFEYEIIIVVDGEIDKTYDKIKKYKNFHIKIFQLKENSGKGYAVKFGMLKARGDIVGFIDSGMDLDPTGISMLLNHMEWYNADIIIGSKLHPVSQVNYPFGRTILSWGYRTLTRILFGFQVRDTQVGIKFFKKKVAQNVFPKLTVKGFAFDVEILAVSYALGYKRIFEAPIKLQFNGASSITSSKVLKTIVAMLVDTLIIYYRIKILQSYKKKMQLLHVQIEP